MSSGSSSPLSSSLTVSSPPSPKLKSSSHLGQGLFYNPQVQPSSIIEYIASRSANTSTVHIYDLAEQVGFGTLTKDWAKLGNGNASAIPLQTRSGAGLSLVGRLSEGTSHDAIQGSVLTAYTTPAGLAAMAHSLAYLPPATANTRLVVQIPNVTSVGETFSLSPTLASLASVLPILPQDIVVLLSSSPQQAVDFATIAYRLSASHVVHIFDHHSSCRELGHSVSPLREQVSNTTDVSQILQDAGYRFFDYVGDSEAQTVIVLLNGPLAVAATAFASRTTGLGVVVVNVLQPWDETALRIILPDTVENVHVIDDVPNVTTQGVLYLKVFGSLLEGDRRYTVHPHRITPPSTQEFLTHKNTFRDFISALAPNTIDGGLSNLSKGLLFFSDPQSPLSSLPRVAEELFLSTKGVRPRLLTNHDVISKAGVVTADRLLLSPRSGVAEPVPIDYILPVDPESLGESDFLAVLDHTLLKSHSLLKHAKPGTPILVVSSWTSEEFAANLPPSVSALASERKLRIFRIDVKGLAAKIVGAAGPINDAIQNVLALLALVRLYLGTAATEKTVLAVTAGSVGNSVHDILVEKLNAHAWAGLEEVELPPVPTNDLETSTTLKDFEFNAIAIETEDGQTVVNGARLSSWHDAAKHLLFPSIYTPEWTPSDEFAQNPALRPEVPDRTFLVTCSVNRRLTPLEYDRNVFHLEFDTRGTGLKYAIGEALGVHGWNDEAEVLDFCQWYGVDPNRLVTIPIPSGDGTSHTRTVFQALQQQVDLFGRPPKSFYTDLAPYATSSVDKHALLFIGSPEGSATFKKMAEKDTVTFADVLRAYPSARPGIERLCELVGDIKPRHYSIASAQSVVGDQVDLLVVTVDWLTPSGSPRYGQCTRYLAGLRVGQKVTVSIKPSVMKLPPDVKQPIIMAGLGTGAAPFRAFLQHLALLQQQGETIGPVYYYFGSRHQSQEYLYGEEVEAFILGGTITRAGLAFSRDGPKKVYIQHKMLEDSEALARMLYQDKGVFYLCGPTWPVPDVYEALVNAMVKYQGSTAEAAGEYLERLKEEERYVLEVY